MNLTELAAEITRLAQAALPQRSRNMSDKKWPIGALVMVGDRMAEVIHHGRDDGGVYTRVYFADGTEEDYHRSCLRPHVHASDGSCDCYYWRRAHK